MNIYDKLAESLEPKYNAAEEMILNIKSAVYSLEKEAQQLRFFSLKGPEKIQKARIIKGNVRELQEYITGINEELEEMGEGQSLEQGIYDAFTNLNDRARDANTVISNIEKKLKNVNQLITETNFWACLYEIFEEIGRVLSEVSFKVVKISKRALLKAAEEAKTLPPSSYRRQWLESVASIVSNFSGVLRGD